MEIQQEPIRFVILTQDILACKELTTNEKLVFARISGFKEFFEAPEMTAEFLNISIDTVRAAKQKLVKLGFILELTNTGRGKIYAPNLNALLSRVGDSTNQIREIYQSDWGNSPIENKERIKREFKTKVLKAKPPIEPVENLADEAGTLVTSLEDEKPKTYGKNEINEFMQRFKGATDCDCSKIRKERYAVNNLLKKHSSGEIDEILNILAEATESGDRYAPSITKPSELVGQYSKLDKLKAWHKRRKAPETPEPVLRDAPPMAFAPMMNHASDLPPIRVLSDEEHAEASRVIREIKATAKWYKPKGERSNEDER